MRRIVLLMSAMFAAISMAVAQDITGKVMDEKGNPLVGANVLLLSKADSTYIAGTTTDNDGFFVLASQSEGGVLMFSYLGYHSIYHTLAGRNVGIKQMQENTQMLDAVTITGSRITNNAKGYSLRPDGTGLENCNTSQEMFAYLPGITVSDDKIMLLDKLPVVYVNGVKITSQDELAALQPKRIAHVEVDYFAIGEGASEKGGVIRITTKKERDGGYSGYLSERVSAMTAYGHTVDAPTFVFNASTGKWTFNYYAVYTHQKLLEDATHAYQYASGKWTNTTQKTRSWMKNFGSRLNISYELNSRSTLAVSEYIGNMDIRNKHDNLVESFLNEDADGETNEVQLYGPESKFVQQTVGKYMLKTDEQGSNLEITADYLFQNYHFQQFENKDDVRTSESRTKEKTNMYRIHPNYTKKYAGGKELKLGADYQYIRYNDETASLRNKANVQIPSAYISYSGRAKMLMYSAGLTLQYNRMEVHTGETETVFDDAYLCPQANLMWMINPQKGTMLALMYQGSASDMPYSVINGYKNYSTPYHYTVGNPSLHTPRAHQLMARLAVNRHLSLMLLYGRESDAIYYEHGVDEENHNITWSRPENGDYRQMLGSRVEWTYAPTKWWNTKVQVAAMQERFVSPEETLEGKWSGKFWWNNNFNFNPTFGGSLNGYWETGTSFENYSWRPVGSLNASLWKSLCKDKLRLSLQSVICAKGRKSRTTGEGYTSYYHNATKPTSFTFTLTWNFAGGKSVRQRAEAQSIQQYSKIEERK